VSHEDIPALDWWWLPSSVTSALEVNQMKHLMKGMTVIEKQLHRLYEEMNRMIDEGDQAPANDMIEAKY
jgi:hypothetical protein